jgi:hypothetical protein
VHRGYRVVYTPAAVVRHPFPDTWAELCEYHIEALEESAGLLAYLFVEEPTFRRVILRYILRRLPRSRRRSFQHAPAEAKRIAPRWREVLAGLRGLASARALFGSQSGQTEVSIERPSYGSLNHGNPPSFYASATGDVLQADPKPPSE